MILVNTSLQVAQQRNLERERTLPIRYSSKVMARSTTKSYEISANIWCRQIHIIDNSGGLEDIDRQKNFDKVYNEIQRFINTPSNIKKH